MAFLYGIILWCSVRVGEVRSLRGGWGWGGGVVSHQTARQVTFSLRRYFVVLCEGWRSAFSQRWWGEGGRCGVVSHQTIAAREGAARQVTLLSKVYYIIR